MFVSTGDQTHHKLPRVLFYHQAMCDLLVWYSSWVWKDLSTVAITRWSEIRWVTNKAYLQLQRHPTSFLIPFHSSCWQLRLRKRFINNYPKLTKAVLVPVALWIIHYSPLNSIWKIVGRNEGTGLGRQEGLWFSVLTSSTLSIKLTIPMPSSVLVNVL